MTRDARPASSVVSSTVDPPPERVTGVVARSGSAWVSVVRGSPRLKAESEIISGPAAGMGMEHPSMVRGKTTLV